MGTRGGPKNIPAAIKIARGTVRKGDLANEPHQPALAVVPAPPDSLGITGKDKWREWGEHLRQLGLLERRYLDALEMYCRAWDRLVYCEDVLSVQGEFYTAQSGYVGRHPAANGAKQARDEIRRYQQEFGFTPSSSAGVKTSAPGKAGVRTRQRGAS